MIKSRKVCFSFFVFFLIPIVLSAKPNFLFDVGRMSFSGVFGDIETSFRPTLTIPEVYFIEDKTGLYTSISPFEIQFKYQPQDYAYTYQGKEFYQNWTVSNISFVNGNFGWMKQLNKELLLETYVRVNAVSGMDINRFAFKPTCELSWTPSFMDKILNPDKAIFMNKTLSVQAGASFDSLKNYKPDFFVTASVDFVLFAGMMGSFFHM